MHVVLVPCVGPTGYEVVDVASIVHFVAVEVRLAEQAERARARADQAHPAHAERAHTLEFRRLRGVRIDHHAAVGIDHCTLLAKLFIRHDH